MKEAPCREVVIVADQLGRTAADCLVQSVTTSVKNVMMRSPRPFECRVRNDGYQGSSSGGRLGPLPRQLS